MASRMAPSTSPETRSWPRLMLLVEAFQHAARLLDGVARALERDVVAALLGDDAEPALDQREVLAVLAEQHGGKTVVVEGQHDLGRRAFRGRDQSVAGAEWAQRHQARDSSQACESGAGTVGASASVAEQAVGADLGDPHRRNLADRRPAP